MRRAKTTARDYLSEILPRESAGFQRNIAQIDYVSSMTDAFNQGPGNLSCIEGGTGIGKTLAYLLSAGDWIAHARKRRRRVIVSTYSRALQRQLLADDNVAQVNAYQGYARRRPLRMALRMGRSNYVSHARLALMFGVADLADVRDDTARAHDERDLAEWALSSNGCLLDLDDSELPDGIAMADIALTRDEAAPPTLLEDFAQCRDADILVINHSLLVSDLLSEGSLAGVIDDDSEVALILDEGEHFAEVAQNCTRHSLSYANVTRVARALGYKKNAQRWSELFEATCDARHADEARALSDTSQEQLLAALNAIKRTPKHDPETSANHAAWMQIREAAEQVERRLRRGRENTVVCYSPVRGEPRLVTANPGAGAIIRNGLDDRITIFTSATLSDMTATDYLPSFRYLLSELRISHADRRVSTLARHEASAFGRLSFKRPTAPCKPLDSSDGMHELSPQYAAYAVEHTLADSPGRTLVLCNSYADVDVLLAHWPDRLRSRAVTHGRGASLNDIAEGMARDDVLLTPAGWEGLSPQRQGEPFWSRVVLLRNPAPPPDQAFVLVSQMSYQQRGYSRQHAFRKAMRSMYARNTARVLHRIRQGIGRALRHPDDVAEIVILDPRFRSDGRQTMGQLAGMAAAIPRRFQRQFRDAVRPNSRLDALPL